MPKKQNHTAKRVVVRSRFNANQRALGNAYLTFEEWLFRLSESYSKDYKGGYWEMYLTPDGKGLFMVPSVSTEDGKLSVSSPQNFYEGSMSPLAFGISMTMVAQSELIMHLYQQGKQALAEKVADCHYALSDWYHKEYSGLSQEDRDAICACWTTVPGDSQRHSFRVTEPWRPEARDCFSTDNQPGKAS